MVRYDYDRSRWKANNPEYEVKILRKLDVDGSKTYGELLDELKWGTRTLSLYLDALVEKDCIEQNKRGRKVFYTLIRTNPYVGRMLGWDRLPNHDIRIRKRARLDKLDEEQFVSDWLNSIEFGFLGIIHDFLLLGQVKDSEGEKTIRRFLKGHISDLTDTITFYGERMSKGIRLGRLDTDKIWEEHEKLSKKIEDEFMR